MTDRRQNAIVEVLVMLDVGEVTTYGDVAADAGYPRHARLVGRVLATTTVDVPWWRVVNAAGRLAPGKEREQGALLRAENVTVRDGRVWDAPSGRFRRHARPPRVS